MTSKYEQIPITNESPYPPSSPNSSINNKKKKNLHAAKRSFSDLVSIPLPNLSYIDPFNSIKIKQVLEEDSSDDDSSRNSLDSLESYKDDNSLLQQEEEKEELISSSDNLIPRVGSLKAAKLRVSPSLSSIFHLLTPFNSNREKIYYTLYHF